MRTSTLLQSSTRTALSWASTAKLISPTVLGIKRSFFFSPGDTGFRVWKTRYCTIGVGICWDQWFPECARAMALMGADVLFYPTAIGSEPGIPGDALYSRDHWRRVMQGHAGANMVPVITSNRVGTEKAKSLNQHITFYGSSFITDPTGKILKEASETEDGAVLCAEFDLDALRRQRTGWGLFRDRRPEHYRVLLSMDGHTSSPAHSPY
eukprot:Rmarinus@m.19883